MGIGETVDLDCIDYVWKKMGVWAIYRFELYATGNKNHGYLRNCRFGLYWLCINKNGCLSNV